MARPVEFDRAAALDAAMLAFWRQGYQAAGMNDLLADMQISRSSFYAAFGDKRALFEACLDQFADRTLALLERTRAAHPPVAALRQFFERGVRRPGAPEDAWGCLLVNTVLEMAEVDPGLNARAARLLTRVEAAFEACLRDAGLAPDRAAELAGFLMLLNEGLRVSIRKGLDRSVLKARIASAFRVLDLALEPREPAP